MYNMKNLKFIFVSLLLIIYNSLTSYSQSSIDIGLGIVNSHISLNNPDLNSQNMLGQEISVSYSKEIKNNFRYNLGIYYQSNEFFIQMKNGTTYNYNLDFLRIPASISYMAINKKIKLSVIGGPCIGLRLNAQEDFYLRNTIGGEILNHTHNKINDEFKKIDLGVFLGFQLGIKNGLSLNGKYWYSFNKLSYNIIDDGNLSFLSLGLSYNILKLFH